MVSKNVYISEKNEVTFLMIFTFIMKIYFKINKVIVFEKGNLLFVFNFHPSQSFEHYKVGTPWRVDH